MQIIDQVQPASLELSADRGLIEQILINLIRNATQALADSEPGATDGEIRLTARLNSRGQTCLEVTDNGPGIAEEVAARMFVPFYTTRKEGTGVGLALSRQIMNAHGGSIGYSQALNGGARFTLVFGA